MRWYVSRAGETVGPVEEAQVVAWVRGGMRDGMVRDEAGGPWTPVEQSPFMAGVAAVQPVRSGNRLAAAGAVGLATAFAGFVFFGTFGALAGGFGGFLLGLAVGNARIG